MKKYLLVSIALFIALSVCLGGCASKKQTVKVIKPKKHLFTYNPKWHKKVHRTRVVKMKN